MVEQGRREPAPHFPSLRWTTADLADAYGLIDPGVKAVEMRTIISLIVCAAGVGFAAIYWRSGRDVVLPSEAAAFGPRQALESSANAEIHRGATRQPTISPERPASVAGGLEDSSNTANVPSVTSPRLLSSADEVQSRVPGNRQRRPDNRSRIDIVHEVLKELTRVGCYAGEVTGTWGPGPRRSLEAFLNDVNARLPVDKPDIVVLTLLQTHVGQACDRPCQMGRHNSTDGNCGVAAAPISKQAQANASSVVPARTEGATAPASGSVRATRDLPSPYGIGRTSPPTLQSNAATHGNWARTVFSDVPLSGR